MNRLPETITKVAIVIFAVSVFPLGAMAQQKQKSQQESAEKNSVVVNIENKEVQGQISSISKEYISIITKSDPTQGTEEEIVFNYDKTKLKVEHKKNLAELQVGDTVYVQYQVVSEEDAQGVKKESRNMTLISFVKPAEINSESVQPAGNLNLKGLK